MMGHATAEETARIRALEERAQSGVASIEDLLDLGCLFIEPMHDSERAIACFETVLHLEPTCSLAKIWIAYCHLQYSMDNHSLGIGRQLLHEVIASDPANRGAALMLSAEIGNASGEASKDEVIALLEASVAAEHGWVTNRIYLANRYASVGRPREADEQLTKALRHIIPEEPRWSSRRQLFEVFISGRTSFGVAEWIEQMRRKLPA